MAVFRIEKTRDYTVMANHHLRNTALSLKAKGLLSLMLSFEYSCAVTPQVRQTGNRLSGLAGTAYASLLT